MLKLCKKIIHIIINLVVQKCEMKDEEFVKGIDNSLSTDSVKFRGTGVGHYWCKWILPRK